MPRRSHGLARVMPLAKYSARGLAPAARLRSMLRNRERSALSSLMGLSPADYGRTETVARSPAKTEVPN